MLQHQPFSPHTSSKQQHIYIYSLSLSPWLDCKILTKFPYFSWGAGQWASISYHKRLSLMIIGEKLNACNQQSTASIAKYIFFPSLDISSLVPAAPHDKCPLPSLDKVSNVIFRLNKFSFLSTRGFDQMLWSQTSHLL